MSNYQLADDGEPDAYLDVIVNPDKAKICSGPDAELSAANQAKRVAITLSQPFSASDVTSGQAFVFRPWHPTSPLLICRPVTVPVTAANALGVVAQITTSASLLNFVAGAVIGSRLLVQPTGMGVGGQIGGTIETATIPPHTPYGSVDPTRLSILPSPWYSGASLAVEGVGMRGLPYAINKGYLLRGAGVPFPRGAGRQFFLATAQTSSTATTPGNTIYDSAYMGSVSIHGRITFTVDLAITNAGAVAPNLVFTVTTRVLDGTGAYTALFGYGSNGFTVTASAAAVSETHLLSGVVDSNVDLSNVTIVATSGGGAGITVVVRSILFNYDSTDAAANSHIIVGRTVGVPQDVPVTYTYNGAMNATPTLALMAEMNPSDVTVSHSSSSDLVMSLMATQHLHANMPLPRFNEESAALFGVHPMALMQRAGVMDWIKKGAGAVVRYAPGIIRGIGTGARFARMVQGASEVPWGSTVAADRTTASDEPQEPLPQTASDAPRRALPGGVVARSSSAPADVEGLAYPLDEIDTTAKGLDWNGLVGFEYGGALINALVWARGPPGTGIARTFAAGTVFQTIDVPLKLLEVPGRVPGGPSPARVLPGSRHASWEDVGTERQRSSGGVVRVSDVVAAVIRGRMAGSNWSSAWFPAEDSRGGHVNLFVASRFPLTSTDPKHQYHYQETTAGGGVSMVCWTLAATRTRLAALAHRCQASGMYLTVVARQGDGLVVDETSYFLAAFVAMTGCVQSRGGYCFSGSVDIASTSIRPVVGYPKKSAAAAAQNLLLVGNFGDHAGSPPGEPIPDGGYAFVADTRDLVSLPGREAMPSVFTEASASNDADAPLIPGQVDYTLANKRWNAIPMQVVQPVATDASRRARTAPPEDAATSYQAGVITDDLRTGPAGVARLLRGLADHLGAGAKTPKRARKAAPSALASNASGKKPAAAPRPKLAGSAEGVKAKKAYSPEKIKKLQESNARRKAARAEKKRLAGAPPAAAQGSLDGPPILPSEASRVRRA